MYQNAYEVIDQFQVKKNIPRANKEKKEEPKFAFCISTLAVIYTSVLVFVVAVVLSVVAIILVSKYKDDSTASSVMLQRNTTQEFLALQIQINNVGQAFQDQLSISSEDTRRLITQLHRTFQNQVFDYKQETQQLFVDLQIQLNNSNIQIQTLQSQLSQTDQEVGSLQAVLTNSNQDIQSQLNESIVAYRLQLNNSNKDMHDLLSITTQAILIQINSSNVEIQELQSKIETLTQPCPGSDASQPASSCQQILDCNSSIPSGHYWITLENGTTILRYCSMNRACGGIDGGWMRVAMVDMREDNATCSNELMEYVYSEHTLCGTGGNGCSQVFFDTNFEI